MTISTELQEQVLDALLLMRAGGVRCYDWPEDAHGLSLKVKAYAMALSRRDVPAEIIGEVALECLSRMSTMPSASEFVAACQDVLEQMTECVVVDQTDDIVPVVSLARVPRGMPQARRLQLVNQIRAERGLTPISPAIEPRTEESE